jgi:uncharacterized membrane protein
MSISGKHHLHHRLLAVGLSVNQVLFFEIAVFSIFAVMAYFLAGFGQIMLSIISSISIVLVLFISITMLKKSRKPDNQILVANDIRSALQNESIANGEGKKGTSTTRKAPDKEYAY